MQVVFLSIIVISSLTSFLVSLVMMSWHMWHARKLMNKYFDTERSILEKYSATIIASTITDKRK